MVYGGSIVGGPTSAEDTSSLLTSAALVERSPTVWPERRIGVLTEDHLVVEQVHEVLRGSPCVVTLARDAASAEALLESQDTTAVLVDLQAQAALPLGRIFRFVRSGLLLGYRSADPGRGPGKLECEYFRRSELERALLRMRSMVVDAEDWLSAHVRGADPAVEAVRRQIALVARFQEVAVLVLGETGTGKELVATGIHELGVGSHRPFVAVNCAAIPEALFESELFGHEAGAFTGARTGRIGLLEAARGGTVFLDEIGEMPTSVQAKLLRALETRSIRRVGSNLTIPLATRIVSATHRVALAHGRADGGLRPDLYYRLGGFRIQLPPLRERASDIPELARCLLVGFAERNGVPEPTLESEALVALGEHAWPGNVRELRCVLEHASILAAGGRISSEHVREALRSSPDVPELARRRGSSAPPPSSGRGPHSEPPSSRRPAVSLGSRSPGSGEAYSRRAIRDAERRMILDAFARAGGNLSQAASMLGMPRTTLRERLRKYTGATAEE